MIEDHDLMPARPFVDYLPERVVVDCPGNTLHGVQGCVLDLPRRKGKVAVEFDRLLLAWPFVRYFAPKVLKEVSE